MKKSKFEKKLWKKIISGFLAFVMILSGISTAWKMDEAKASETTSAHAVYYEYDDMSGFRSGEPTAPKPTEEAYKNWIFAGWYAEEALTTPLTHSAANSATDGAWAKFVPAEILSVMGQMNSDPSTADSVKLRLVTTIDTEEDNRYANVGFDIRIPNLGYSQTHPMTDAYKKIVANDDGVKFEYEPSVFHEMSKAFATATISSVSKANFDTGIYVTPYWTTMDGTRVDGVGRYLRANDVLGTTVNVPVRLYSDTAVTEGSLTVNYDADTFTYLGMDNGNTFTEVSVDTTTTAGQVVCSVADQTATADGMLANIRFQLKDGVALLNRDAFENFSVTGETTWNASYKVYTSMEALSDVIPDKLPGNLSYTIPNRVGLDSAEEGTVYTESTKLVNPTWTGLDKGVFGGSFQFTHNGSNTAEGTITPANSINLKDVTGVLWYVDFSTVTAANNATLRASVPLVSGSYTYRSGENYGGSNIGYFYNTETQEWTEIASGADGCRMPMPEGSSKGWIYVPLTSYGCKTTGASALCDSETGLGNDVDISKMNLYTGGYSRTAEANQGCTFIFDEILFVRAEQLKDVIPTTVPEGTDTISESGYTIKNRIGLDSADEFSITLGTASATQVSDTGAVFGSALNVVSNTPGDSVQFTLNLATENRFSLEGVSGILWHIDFKDATLADGQTFFRTSLPIFAGTKQYMARSGYANGKDIGYFYNETSGEWTQIADGKSGCRLPLPAGSKGGWIYVPLNAYGHNTGEILYDETTGLGKDITLRGLYLFANLFTAGVDNTIVLDEVLFVTKQGDVNVADSTVGEGDSAISVQIGNKVAELKEMFVTEADNTKLVAGKDLTISANVTTTTVADDVATSLESTLTANNLIQGEVLDITLQKLFAGSDETAETITTINGNSKLALTVTIPESLKTSDEQIIRTYKLIKADATECEVLTDTDTNENTITFETDDLSNSVYVLAYNEVKLADLIPASLPGDATYSIGDRIGLDSSDGVTVSGTKYYDGQFTETGAIFGSAYKFACNMEQTGTNKRGECTITFAESNYASVEGAAGILWYVDFSDVTADTSKSGIGVTIPITFKNGGSTATARSYATGAAIGYYYQDGNWVETAPADGYGDRMIIPNNQDGTGYKGWIYIPFTAYRQVSTLLYDSETGLGLEGVTVTGLQLYTEGYIYTSDHYTLFDEVLFVKKN